MSVENLFVTHKAKSEDGEFGFTDNTDCIKRNLDIIDKSYYNRFIEALGKSSGETIMDTCICGRYISVIQLSKDNTGLMFFLDSYNDFEKALLLYERLPKEDKLLRQRFEESFQKLFPIYDEMKDSVELEFCP